MSNNKSPIYKSGRYRPWLWPVRLFNRFTKPIPAGLWFVNFFCQKVLDINNSVPWMVHFTSVVVGEIIIGKNVWTSFALSGNCYIQGTNGIFIGDDTIFAPGVKIISANHDPENLQLLTDSPPIQIGSRSWIGTNSVILPGAKIGNNCIIAAGSVVTKPIPDWSIAAGNPARIIRKRNDQP